jgi:hypothetical protein
METLIDLLLDEFYFPTLPREAAEAANIAWEDAWPVLEAMRTEGLIRREDYAEAPIHEKTLLVATKKGLLRANGLD